MTDRRRARMHEGERGAGDHPGRAREEDRQTIEEGARRKLELFARRGAKLDLNTATANALAGIPGIGDSAARRIVEYREANGPFTSVDDLRRVEGLDDETVLRTIRERGIL